MCRSDGLDGTRSAPATFITIRSNQALAANKQQTRTGIVILSSQQQLSAIHASKQYQPLKRMDKGLGQPSQFSSSLPVFLRMMGI
jgi:hypothetical protein